MSSGRSAGSAPVVAIVGATGAVGVELIRCLEERRFPLSERHAIRDVSAATLPKDFERNPRIHRCFEVRLP